MVEQSSIDVAPDVELADMNDQIRRDSRDSGLEAMAIVFCANPAYFQHLATAAVSAAANCHMSDLDIHVLSCDRDDNAERMLHESLRAYEHVSLSLHRVSDVSIKGYFIDGFITKECYLRLMVGEVLPERLKRVIYLDCDVDRSRRSAATLE